MIGGKEAQGMGTVSIKTQPKGAQIAINQHMLEKSTPVDIMLDPGNSLAILQRFAGESLVCFAGKAYCAPWLLRVLADTIH